MSSSNASFVNEFVEFMTESCSAYHAVEASSKIMDNAGFTRIYEDSEWKLVKGGKYYFTRNTTSLIAFTVGGLYENGNGFTVVGAHTDSPCLRIKPKCCSVKNGALVLNTQPYGGGLWHVRNSHRSDNFI